MADFIRLVAFLARMAPRGSGPRKTDGLVWHVLAWAHWCFWGVLAVGALLFLVGLMVS